MTRPKRDLHRITINVPLHVLDLIDAYALNNGLSRTTAITVLCVDGLKNNGLLVPVKSNDAKNEPQSVEKKPAFEELFNYAEQRRTSQVKSNLKKNELERFDS